MAQLLELAGGGPVTEGERVTVAHLVKSLPDDYLVVPNIEITERSGHRLEYDVVVAAPHAVYVLEIKAWMGSIVADDREWNVDGRSRAAPIRITSQKARVLKGRLSDEVPLLGGVWVEPAIVLAVPPRSIEYLDRETERTTFLLPDLVAFLTDPTKLPYRRKPVERVPERVGQVLRSKATASSGPTAFNQYEVIETIDFDGTTTEYRAVHRHAPDGAAFRLQVVSLSPYVFRPDELERKRAMLTREFRALHAMGPHPNVAAARDVFEDEHGNMVIVSEEVGGLSLAMGLAEGLDASESERLTYLEGLAQAVAHAHSHGVIHRRLTPENVVLEGDIARLVGFGAARLATEGTIYQTSAVPSVDLAYLAPELAQQRRSEVGEQSDLFGLAAIGWALWSGSAPFAESWRADPSGLEAPADMPEALASELRSALFADPTHRTMTTGSLLAAIQAIQLPVAPAVETAGLAPDAPRAPARYQPGDPINNRYEVQELLGSGAFSTVYRVTDAVRGEDCAMKVFTANYGLDVVQRELRALLRINHPNVVKVIDAGQTETAPAMWFLKSELVDGRDLVPFTTGEERLSIDESIGLVLQLLSALEAIHPDTRRIAELKAKGEESGGLEMEEYYELQELEDDGLVHRDIKPQNLMLTTRGSIKLIDFNIASRVGDPVVTMAGTPEYRPADANLTRWDTSTDLFATGVVLYELLTGSHPYPNSNPAAASQPNPARSIVPDLPDALDRFLQQACAARSAERFATASEMKAALERAVGAGPDPSMFASGGDVSTIDEGEVPAVEVALSAAGAVGEQPSLRPAGAVAPQAPLDEEAAALAVVADFAATFLDDPAGTLGEKWGVTLRRRKGDGELLGRLNAGLQLLLDVRMVDGREAVDVCVSTTGGRTEIEDFAARFGGEVRPGFDKRAVPNVLVRFDDLDAAQRFMADDVVKERIREIAEHVSSRRLLNPGWHSPATTDRLLVLLPPPARPRNLPELTVDDVDGRVVRDCVAALPSTFATADIVEDPSVRSAHAPFADGETAHATVAKWLAQNDSRLHIRKTPRSGPRGAVWEKM